MKFSSIVLRAVPFILTFTVGLLIASIFVPISAPSFGSKNRFENNRRHEGHKRHKRSEYRRSTSEVMELRQKNLELQNELNELKLRYKVRDIEAEARTLRDNIVPPLETPVRNAKAISVPVK